MPEDEEIGMDWTYIKIRSWHVARPKDYTAKSYCGKSLEGRTETSATLPRGKTCESCLAITRRIEEHNAKAVADEQGIVSHDPSAVA
jgi:hypothetical protein